MKFKEFITFLGTDDLKKTSQFYQDILGLTLYKDQKVCLIFSINEQSKIGFCEHMPVVYKDKRSKWVYNRNTKISKIVITNLNYVRIMILCSISKFA